jgi:hypothetical protein
MTRRTEIQLAILVMGLIVWAYGQRTENDTLTWFGIAFFAAATALRFFKRERQSDGEHPPPEDPPDR